ncbi:MAG: LamG domain-containing protein [Verrucomicrobiota bacterium]
MILNKLLTGNCKLLLSAATFALLGLQVAKADYPSTILADGPIAFYRFNEPLGVTMNDSSATGQFPGTYVYSSDNLYPELGQPGIETNSIFVSASDPDPGYAYAGYYPQFNGQSPFTFEIWAKPSSLDPVNYRCPVGNFSGWNTATQSGWYVYQTPGTPSTFAFVMQPNGSWINNASITAGSWYHLVGTYDGTNASFYVNGVLIGSQNVAGFVANSVNNANGNPLGIGERGDDAEFFSGNLDDFAYYTNALTAAQILNHYQVGTNSFSQGPVPPSILNSPVDVSVYAGQTAGFSVLAGGSTPLYYQWYDGTNAILNATNDAYSFVTSPTNDGTSFTVVITNFVGSITSTPVTLSVSTSILLDADVTSITRNVGSAAAFEVAAEGAQPLTYQWYTSDNAPIAGATNNLLWLTNVQAAASGTGYYADINNPYTTLQSSTATLTVQPRPVNVPITGYAKVVVADGPVAYWRLDEPSGSTNAVDAVGSFNGSYLPGNGSFDFDATTGIPNSTDGAIGITNGATVSFPYAIEINPPGAFSVEGWFQATSLPANPNDYRTPISSMSNPFGEGPTGWLVYQTAANNWSWWPYSGYYGSVQLTDSDQIVVNQWYYLTLVYDGTTFTFYVNGVAQASGTDSGFVQNGNVPEVAGSSSYYNYNYTDNNGNGITGSYPTVLGWRSDEGFNPFEGTIDEVAVYNKPLTPQQIQNHFLNTTHLTASTSGNNIVISWSTGTLQSAPTVYGPFTNIAGATSPYTNAISGAQLFFRAQVE